MSRKFIKPWYVYTPAVGLRRVWRALLPPKGFVHRVGLPWKVSMEVDRRDTVGNLIFQHRVYELATSELVWRLLEDEHLAVDVGANIGYMTGLFAARLGPGGTVHAIEPHPGTFGQLMRNVDGFSQNPACARIEAHQCALSDHEGTGELRAHPSPANQALATLRQAVAGDNLDQSLPVPLRKFDQLFGVIPCGLVKIDTEGHELAVLHGAADALASGAVGHIIYEDFDAQGSGVSPFLRSFGYEVFSIGYEMRGPLLLAEDSCGIDRGWEPPNYLATRDVRRAKRLAGPRGWRCLRGR